MSPMNPHRWNVSHSRLPVNLFLIWTLRAWRTRHKNQFIFVFTFECLLLCEASILIQSKFVHLQTKHFFYKRKIRLPNGCIFASDSMCYVPLLFKICASQLCMYHASMHSAHIMYCQFGIHHLFSIYLWDISNRRQLNCVCSTCCWTLVYAAATRAQGTRTQTYSDSVRIRIHQICWVGSTIGCASVLGRPSRIGP